jgi:hypothetical protein
MPQRAVSGKSGRGGGLISASAGNARIRTKRVDGFYRWDGIHKLIASLSYQTLDVC